MFTDPRARKLGTCCCCDPDIAIKEPVASEYRLWKAKADKDGSAIQKLTEEDCTRLIIEITRDYPATIILDALDECEEDKRYHLLEAFDTIISNSVSNVKIFVSLLFLQELHLDGCRDIRISVKNNSDDIKRFVQSEVDRLST